MKKQIKYLCAGLLLLMAACGTTTMITSSWRKPNATASGYRNVFIAAISNNIPVKQRVEEGLKQLLQDRGLTVSKSTDVFPPEFSTVTGQKHELIIDKIKGTGADAILTIALLKEDTETHYVGGSRAGMWNPMSYGYYGTFWGYYNNWYPYIYSPGYYDEQKVYYLETNLFDARTEQLIWAAQSKTYDPINLESFLKGYVKSIHDQMVKDGLITENAMAGTR
jgi:hypothetical protein